MDDILTLSNEEVDYWGDQYLKWQQPIPEDLLNRLSEFERQQYLWAHNFTFFEFINLCLRHLNKTTPHSKRSRFK